MIYVNAECQIEESKDGGYIVWTRVHGGAAWRAAPIPAEAVGAIVVNEIEHKLKRTGEETNG
jgi:hypothetical protein